MFLSIIFTRLTVQISLALALLGLVFGVIGTGLVGVSLYLNRPGPVEASAQGVDCPAEAHCNSVEYARQTGEVRPAMPEGRLGDQVVIAPLNKEEDTIAIRPTEFYKPIENAPLDILPAQRPSPIRTPIPPKNIVVKRSTGALSRSTPAMTPQVEVILEPVESYTSTVQVQPPPSTEVEEQAAEPLTPSGCPAASMASFDLIPIEGRPLRDHPAEVHGDLNLALRGYIPTSEAPSLITYEGNTDADAPQLTSLFDPNRQAQIQGVYRVNDWIWDSAQCGGHPRGCPGPPAATFWPVTLVALVTTPGEAIYPPERSAQIYSGGYIAMVLYAEERHITLGYTRRNSVATGYVVHIEDICVDPNLVALYWAQLDAEGWNDTGRLPALRPNQALGRALVSEIKVAIRDAGSFMDPRSQKDWWR